MIEVDYNRKKVSVTIKGHANAGKKGEDLVCAACSQTAYIFAAAVYGMAEKNMGQEPTVELTSGDSKIVFKPYSESKHLCLFALDNIAKGFELLANTYPGKIYFKIIE